MKELFLGKSESTEIKLPIHTLLRHAVCLGSSGSGKTVACKVIVEECLMQGIPVIAVDPQGDIASLAHLGNPEEIEQRGVSLGKYEAYRDKAEVVVWTPASALGVPLSINPLAVSGSPDEAEREEDLLRDRNFAAESLTDLLGFDLNHDKGRAVIALLSLLLSYASETGKPLQHVSQLLQLLTAMPKTLADRIASIAEESLIDNVIRRLRMVSMGPQGLMLQGGIPLDIDTLLGRNDPHLQESGKTRLSVIYLNTLSTERDRQFFLGQLAQSLYRWMLAHPSSDPQALFYVDEVAPYIPPVRKPVCKDALKLLLRQARKYGVCCMLATQSPGDLDYTALSQIGTWNLGRLMTRQEQKKVEAVLKSIVPTQAEAIAQELPSLRPGHFRLVCPDMSQDPISLQVRWLVTQHRTLDEHTLGAATEPSVRARLEQILGREVSNESATQAEEEQAGPVRGRAEVAVLAVTAKGEGTVNPCEIVVQRGGTGKITALGGQSRESKESIKVAWEAAKGLQQELKLPPQFSRRYDVTVLDTRLAVPKDGPSAGLAYTAGIVAAFKEKSPRPDVAMTGEVTILGKVLPVGGIAQKIEAAYRAGYATVLVPEDNQGDIVVLPPALRDAIEIIPVATVAEALDVVFAPPRREHLIPPHEIAGITDDDEPIVSEQGEDPPPPGVPTHREQVLAFLDKEPVVVDYDTLCESLGLNRNTTTETLRKLEEEGQVFRAKQGRKAVFYSSKHALLPAYNLLGPVEAVRLTCFEPEARKRAANDLARSMLVFEREVITEMFLAYRPLYQIHFSAKVDEGWLFKRTVERQDKLYFDGLTAELLSYVKGKGFLFEAASPSNPVDVVDLDNLACFETRMPGDLPLLLDEMDNMIGEKAAISAATRKFSLEVLHTALVFLPVWRFKIADKETTSTRQFFLDGWEGYPLQLPRSNKKS